MGYYMGDYYRRAGYGVRGDPGFLSVLKTIGSTVAGFIPGVGPIAQKVISSIPTPVSHAAAGAASVALTKPGFYSGASKVIGAAKGVALKHPVLTGAGAAGLVAAAGGAAGAAIEKHMLKGGRRRRRMRATNPKALRRALRRAYAFERIAMRTIKLVHPRKKGRFGGFKRAKKRVC